MKKSNVKILDSRVANWDRGQARSAIRRFSGAIDAVFAAADDMILGAIDAMSEAGIDPASKVTVGFDAIPEALNYMERGRLSATVDQLPAKQAGQAIEHRVAYIKTKTKPPSQVILITPELITKAPMPPSG